MAVGYLNERTQKIITMILKGSSELTIKEIAAEYPCLSGRFTMSDKADGWLAMKKLPLLRVIRGRVIQPFLEEEKLALQSALALETPKKINRCLGDTREDHCVSDHGFGTPGLCGRSDEYLYGER